MSNLQITEIKPKPTIFDFKNITYVWGSTNPNIGLDCFTLHNYIIYKYESRIIPGFDWVSKTWASDDIAPHTLVKTEVHKILGETPTGTGKTLELVLLDWYGHFGIGTILYYLGEKYLVYTGKGKSMVSPYHRYSSRVRGLWDSRPISVTVTDFYGQKL